MLSGFVRPAAVPRVRTTHPKSDIRNPKSSSSVSTFFHLYQAVVKGRAAAHIGQPLGNQRIHAAPAGGSLVQPNRRRRDDASRHFAIHLGHHDANAAIVEYPYGVSAHDSALG